MFFLYTSYWNLDYYKIFPKAIKKILNYKFSVTNKLYKFIINRRDVRAV